MQYNSLAACVVGLIENGLAPARDEEGFLYFGIDKHGDKVLSFDALVTYTIVGAMRRSHTLLEAKANSYTIFYRNVLQLANQHYGCPLEELTHQQALHIFKKLATMY